MRLEWIEDILAILTAGSLSKAAKLRFLTQPAFSRRVKQIEEYIGIELLDRTHKPAQLSSAIIQQQGRLEHLASGMRDLLYELRYQDRLMQGRVIIASQHSITASMAPALVKKLTAGSETQIRLLSANRGECFSMLLTKQADLTLSYHFDHEEMPVDTEFIEQIDFGEELFVPVYQTANMGELDRQYRDDELPIIAYPPDVFMGKVMLRKILPELRRDLMLRQMAESALTLAVSQLALTGVGVAWIPRTLVSNEIDSGVLTDLSDRFGYETFRVYAVRLSGEKSTIENDAWAVLQDAAKERR